MRHSLFPLSTEGGGGKTIEPDRVKKYRCFYGEINRCHCACSHLWF